MPCRSSVYFFAVILLAEGQGAKDGRGDHAGAMNPSHGLVKPDGTALFGSLDSGRADRVIGRDAIKVARDRAQGDVQIARSRAFAPSACTKRRDHGGNHRNGRDQAHTLMNLEHMGTPVEQGLLFGIGFGLGF